MQTSLILDDDLVREAQRLTGTNNIDELVGQALAGLIERETTRRLILLGGSDPTATVPPRRRSAPDLP